MDTRRTFCRICEAACGLVADVDGGRLLALRPDRDHPVSRGFVCAKGTRFGEVAYHPSRLTHPMVRRAGGLEAVAWREAYEVVAQRLGDLRRRYGPHSVGVYFGNPTAFNAQAALLLPLFATALGTRNVFSAGSQDCNNKFAAARELHGSAAIHPFPDFERADLALVFGSNPFVSQSSFVHLPGGARVFDRMVARGGEVVWIDPRRTESAERWGEHIAIRPASDVWLLMALLGLVADGKAPPAPGLEALTAAARAVTIAEVSERTGIAATTIELLAERIRRAPATALHMSVGVNQSGFGTLSYVLLQALAWVSGNFDRHGGLLFHPLAKWMARLLRQSGFDRPRRSRVGEFDSVLGTLPGAIMAEEMKRPGKERIRAMIVIAGDPLRSVPGGDELAGAFDELDHLVSIDMFENATGRLADVLLPATSWLERWDVASASTLFHDGALLQAAGPVIAPLAEARNDARIMCELAQALGLGRGFALGARDWDWLLPKPRFGVPSPRVRPGSYRKSARLDFYPAGIAAEVERLRSTRPERDDRFRLMCRRRRLGHNSWLHGGVRDGTPEEVAWMRGDELAALGLASGDRVTLRSAVATYTLRAEAHDGLAPRTVVVPHGLPEVNVNGLIPSGPDAVERISGQHVMTGIEIEVSAAGRLSIEQGTRNKDQGTDNDRSGSLPP
jgi:formate dehydrogenase